MKTDVEFMKSDLELVKLVQEELEREPKVNATEIGVTAKDGVIGAE